MVKKLVLGPILAPLEKIWAQIFFHGFYLYCMIDIVASWMQFQRKFMNQTWENGKKTSFGPDFGPNLGHQIFFFFPKKIWPCQLLDIMVSYHHVQYKKKKQWSNVEKTWRTDGQTDESDFRGCCPTNVEHPIKKLVAISYEFL